MAHVADLLHLGHCTSLGAPCWLSTALVRLFLQAPTLRAASLGGGPGFDFLALVMAASYLGGGGENGVAVDMGVYDYESGWQDCVGALSAAVQQVRSARHGVRHRSKRSNLGVTQTNTTLTILSTCLKRTTDLQTSSSVSARSIRRTLRDAT